MCEVIGDGFIDYCEDHAWEDMAVVETEVEALGYTIDDAETLFRDLLKHDGQPDFQAFQELSLTILNLHREKRRLEPIVASAVRAFNRTSERVNVNYIVSCDSELSPEKRQVARDAYEDGRAYRDRLNAFRKAPTSPTQSSQVTADAKAIADLNMDERIQLAAETNNGSVLDDLSAVVTTPAASGAEASYFELWSLARAIVRNRCTRADTLTAIAKAYSRELAGGYETEFYEDVMRHPMLSDELLAELVTFARPKRIQSAEVRRKVAGHPASPPTLLKEIGEVAAEVAGAELVANRNTPYETVLVCSVKASPAVRMALASDERTHPAILKSMDDTEKDQDIWHAVLANPSFPYF